MKHACAVLSTLALCVAPRAARAEWPGLESVIERAKVRALVVSDAQGQLGVARASRTGAEALWIGNPYLEVQTYYTPITRELAFQSQLFLPLEINGQRPARLREADALAQWKSSTRDEARARATAVAVAWYGETLVARARLDVATKAEADARSEADLYSARLQAGDATAVDESLAEAELARYSQARAEAGVALMTARAELATLLAQDDLGDPPQGADPPPPRARSADAFVARVLEVSPALRSLGLEARYWDASGERASRDKWTPISLIVNLGRNDAANMQVGGGLAWVFPVTQRNQGPVAVAEAASARATTLQGDTQRVLSQHARHTFEQLETLRASLTALDATGLPAQQKVVDATTSAYRAGKLEFVRVLQARRDLAATLGRRLDLVTQLWHRYAELTALAGELP